MIGLNIEMPKSCSECPCMYDLIYCRADYDLEFDNEDGFEDKFDKRHPKCPLVEIPIVT